MSQTVVAQWNELSYRKQSKPAVLIPTTFSLLPFMKPSEISGTPSPCFRATLFTRQTGHTMDLHGFPARREATERAVSAAGQRRANPPHRKAQLQAASYLQQSLPARIVAPSSSYPQD